VFTLVERGGRARSIKVDNMNGAEVSKILAENVNKHTNLMTDESRLYDKAGKEFARHHRINHGKKQYAKGFVYTNTVEGYFSIFKRGMIGTYQHCGENHLQRYLHEFDFRYSYRQLTDKERADQALKGAEGKRLMYRRSRLVA
jgi:transposase-like protein